MFGKIATIKGIPLKDGFEVTYGIDCEDVYILNFGTIMFQNLDPKVTRTYIFGGHHIEEKADGYKDIKIFNGDLSADDQEEYLLVIIPHALQIISNSKRIAGRYYTEAILEMHNGDYVGVSKSSDGDLEIYMATKVGNEMFLIKKNR